MGSFLLFYSIYCVGWAGLGWAFVLSLKVSVCLSEPTMNYFVKNKIEAGRGQQSEL